MSETASPYPLYPSSFSWVISIANCLDSSLLNLCTFAILGLAWDWTPLTPCTWLSRTMHTSSLTSNCSTLLKHWSKRHLGGEYSRRKPSTDANHQISLQSTIRGSYLGWWKVHNFHLLLQSLRLRHHWWSCPLCLVMPLTKCDRWESTSQGRVMCEHY